MRLKIYRCDTPCTWNGRYWGEGDLTKPLPEDVKPPEYFVEESSSEAIKNALNEIDKEDDPQTFAQLSRQIMDMGNTGVGMLAGDDLNYKSLAQLKKIARELGIDCEGYKSKDDLIEIIQQVQEERE